MQSPSLERNIAMSKVVALMSMSLDGFVADLNDGVAEVFESAVRQAKAAAAGKSVAVHGADTIHQLLNAGLLDEIQVDIAAVLLGSGARLFDHLAGMPAVLGNPKVIPGVGVTHLSAQDVAAASLLALRRSKMLPLQCPWWP
jgi:hypothetical protein